MPGTEWFKAKERSKRGAPIVALVRPVPNVRRKSCGENGKTLSFGIASFSGVCNASIRMCLFLSRFEGNNQRPLPKRERRVLDLATHPRRPRPRCPRWGPVAKLVNALALGASGTPLHKAYVPCGFESHQAYYIRQTIDFKVFVIPYAKR